jgi:hypothetical protein
MEKRKVGSVVKKVIENGEYKKIKKKWGYDMMGGRLPNLT